MNERAQIKSPTLGVIPLFVLGVVFILSISELGPVTTLTVIFLSFVMSLFISMPRRVDTEVDES